MLGLIELRVAVQRLICLEIEAIVAKSTALSRGHVDLHIAILAADHAGVVGKLVVGIKAVIRAFVFFELDGISILGKVFNVLDAVAAVLPVFTVD